MNKSVIRKSIACALAVATIGSSYILPIAPAVFNTGIVVSAASNTVKYKTSKNSAGELIFLGYADPTYDKNDNEQLHYPSGTTMEIPASINGVPVVEIGTLQNVDDFMSVCKTIKIPTSVRKIGANVFSDFSEVTTVTFSGTNITSIGESAFSGCSSLKSIDFKNVNKLTIGKNAFEGCDSLKTVTAGKGGTVVGANAFADLNSLTTVNLNADSGESSISNNAFEESGVTKVTLSKETTSIGASAFENCSKLKEINLGVLSKLTTISANTFSGTALLNIEIPSGVLFIKDNAFADIRNEDDYGDAIYSTLTFKNANNKIKASNNVFEGTEIKSVTIPANLYNTKVGELDISTFGNVHEIIIGSKTQIVRGIPDLNTENLVVKSPFGSYVWACTKKAAYESTEEGVPSYVKFKTTLEDNDKSNGTYKFTTVTLKKVSSNTADGVNVKYTTPIAKSDVNNGAGAKDVVVTVNTGVTKWTLSSVSTIKKFFNYKDTIATNGLSGTFVISTKSNTGLALNSDILSTYDIQAENFDTATVTFDTDTDAKAGIYNKEYGCYVASTESAAVKPTVIVKVGGKVVDKKYYKVTYKDNTGIRANNTASLTVSLTDEGKKIYNTTKTFTKKFTIKMDINKVNIGVTTFIKQGQTAPIDGQPALLTNNADTSAFKPVGVNDSPKFVVNNDSVVCLVKLNNGSTATTLKSKSDGLNLSIAYNKDNYFSQYDELGSGLPVGIVWGTIKAGKNCPYFFGEKEIEYYTKFNINSYNNVSIIGSDESTTSIVSTKDTSTNSKYERVNKNYTYKASAITLGTFSFKVKDNLLVNELPTSAFTVTYTNNVNASLSDAKSKLAYATIKPNSNQKYIFGSRKIYFKIDKKVLTESLFNNIGAVTYTRELLTPAVSGKYNGVALNSSDFTVEYSNNKEPGTGIATIKGKGNYSGTVKKSFVINKANLSTCTVNWHNNTVSWRFGFDVKPVPEVYYKGVLLTKGVDYNVIYLGKYNSGYSYTGAVVKKVGEVGGIAIVPVSTSKYISTSTSGLTNATYGSNKTTGIIKNYTISKIDLANIDFTYRRDLVSNEFGQFKEYLIPNIVVNGQVLKAYTPNEVRSIIYKVKYKNNGGPYQTSRDIPYNTGIVAYYGYETSTGTGFTIQGKMVREVEKESIRNENGKDYAYYLVQDKLYMKNSNGSMVQVSKFYYTSEYDNANTDKIDDAMGIKVSDVTFNVNGIKKTTWMVKPGILHVYTTGSVESENRSMLTSDTATGLEHAWDIYVSPDSPSLYGSQFNIQDNKPGTLNVEFKPSSADAFDGKVTYKVKLYNTKANAINDTNAVKSYSIRYKNGDSTQSTKGLTLSKRNNYLYYQYTITNINPGRQYYVNVIAVDNNTNAESPTCAFPRQCLTTTSAAVIKSAYFEKSGNNDANYNMTVNLSLPSHIVGTTSSKTSISNIFYEIIITSDSGSVLKTYRVSETGKIDKIYKDEQKLTKDTATGLYKITFTDVPGINENSHYYVNVKTYLYYITGNYTSNTYKFECKKNVSGINVGSSNIEAYNINKGAILVSADRNIVNNNTVTVTATASAFNVKNSKCDIGVYSSNGTTAVWEKKGVALTKNKVTYTIPKTVFVNSTDNNVKYTIKVKAVKDDNGVTIIGSYPIIVTPGVKNTSSVNKSADSSDNKIHISKCGSLIVTMNCANTYDNSDTGIYSLIVANYGGDSTYKNVVSTTQLLTSVQKRNGTTYEINGNNFKDLGYYRVTVKLDDGSENGKSKSFNIRVVDEPMNTSIAFSETGYIEDGVCVSLSNQNIKNAKYTLDIFLDSNKGTAIKTYNNIEDGKTYSFGSSSSIKNKAKYSARISVTGKDKSGNLVTKTTDFISLGTLEFGEMINTSTIDKSEVLKNDSTPNGDNGKVTVYPSAKYGGLKAISYVVELENVSSGNVEQLAVKNNKVELDVNAKKLAAGSYVIRVKATRDSGSKDAKGNIIYNTAVQEFYLAVKNVSSWVKSTQLNGVTLSNKSVLNVKEDNTFSIVTTADSTDVKFEYKRSNNAAWKEISNTSETSKTFMYNLKPISTGTFDIRITITDIYGRVIEQTYQIQAK